MPSYLPFSNDDISTFTESEYLLYDEGIQDIAGGYFDTFAMVFGWWDAIPGSYRYYVFGNFNIEQSRSIDHYVVTSKSITHNMGTTGAV
jgi:hypothetical protein